MANVCCSIELEPRTLSQGQINQARVMEVAVDIIQKKVPSEASNIFIEERETLNLTDEAKDKTTNINGISCQCSCTSEKDDSPDQSNQVLKEPLSAPF